MEKMQKLSVVLATYNEEENLPECLDSVADLASEIVVVDGGSRDRTVEVAKKYKAKVIVTDNPQIFHINKQRAIEAATMDWVLQLDADERVSIELDEEIMAILEKNPKSEIRNHKQILNSKDQNSKSIGNLKFKYRNSQVNGYWIPRKNWFLGRFLTKGGQYPDYTLRLYRRGKGKLPCKDVHEQAVVEGRVGYLKNPLFHFADTDLQKYFLRYKRYIDLLVYQMSKKNTRINAFNFFNYLIIRPLSWFLLRYFRNRGYKDGIQGFLFAVFSALRYPLAFMKYFSDILKSQNLCVLLFYLPYVY